ncbi:MAG: DNA adenine methylase [Pseudomonadales bacterium]|nr:DNA adenine methylase [Pseudomonadales bacterium]
MAAKPLVPWIGGKRKLAEHLLPLFPEHDCYVEPFCGGAALFFMKEPSRVEILNDINSELTNLYRIVKYHLEELYREFKWQLTSRDHYNRLKLQAPECLTDIQRAGRFLYLQKNAFGGQVEGQSFGISASSRPKFNLLTIEHDLEEAHFRLQNAYVENLAWDEVIKRYDRPDALFYCDPPYWGTAGYGVSFTFEHYERMAELAKSIQGKMIISINDHPAIRECFKDLPLIEVDYSYTCTAKSKPKKVIELIYCSDKDMITKKKGQSSWL